MFNAPSYTRAAAAIGEFNSDWDEAHIAFQYALLDALVNAPAGTPLSTVAYNAADVLYGQYPTCARGVTCFGSLVGTRNDFIMGVECDEGGVGAVTEWCDFKVVQHSGRTQVVCASDVDCEMELGVYDIQGRRIAVVVEREIEAGRHQFSWFHCDCKGRPAPSGVYFVKLRAKAHCGKERVVVERAMVLR